MSKYIDADSIRGIINKKIKVNTEYGELDLPDRTRFGNDAQILVLQDILSFVDSLQQEQTCDTCVNDKGCVACKDGELLEGKWKQKYTLELTDEQYSLIALCVESVHRISVGQVEELKQILPKKIDRELLVKLKEQSFPELSFSQSYKWCGGHHNKAFSHFQAATYAIYREMRHFCSVHEGQYNVYQSPTLRCEGIDLPKITLQQEQPEVDLENVIEEYWIANGWSKVITLGKFKVIARYFYGVGQLNSK